MRSTEVTRSQYIGRLRSHEVKCLNKVGGLLITYKLITYKLITYKLITDKLITKIYKLITYK